MEVDKAGVKKMTEDLLENLHSQLARILEERISAWFLLTLFNPLPGDRLQTSLCQSHATT